MNALDFINLVMGQLGWDTETDVADLSSDGEKALRVTNIVLSSMQNDKNWSELNVQDTLELTPAFTLTATGTATYGSADVALTADEATALSGSEGYMVQIGSSGFYRVVSYSNPTLTLDTPWREATAALLVIKLAPDQYSLPSDVDHVLNDTVFNRDTGSYPDEISSRDLRRVRNLNGQSLVWGEPKKYSVYGEDASGYKIMHFDALTEDPSQLDFEYQKDHPQLTASSDKILYPDSYLMYISDAVIAKLQRDVENSQAAVQATQDKLHEASQAGKSGSGGRDRLRLRVAGYRHGSYRSK